MSIRLDCMTQAASFLGALQTAQVSTVILILQHSVIWCMNLERKMPSEVGTSNPSFLSSTMIQDQINLISWDGWAESIA